MAGDFGTLTGVLTGGVLSGKSPDYAGAATKQEKFRRSLIEQGLGRINAIFGGGSFPVYSQASGTFSGSTPYYTLSSTGQYKPYNVPRPNNGLAFDPQSAWMASITGGPFSSIAGGLLGGMFGKSKPWSPQSMLTKGRLYTMSQSPQYPGFGEDFYRGREQAYINYALPQLAQQYRDAYGQMRYGLANRGLSYSSAAQQQGSRLNRAVGESRQQIADTARGQAQSLRQNVEDAKQRAIAMLYQTADPANAAQYAISTASGFQTPSTYVPIANTLAGLANQYYTSQLLNAYKNPNYPTQMYPSYNQGALPGVTQ